MLHAPADGVYHICAQNLGDPINPSAVDYLLLDQSAGLPGFFLG